MKSLREDQMFSYGVRSYLYVIGGICLLLFLTGVINFLNLYLVSSLKRGKEYGVKRIFGIHPKGLFAQMWIENLLLVGIALFFAWLWMEITTPWDRTFVGLSLCLYRFQCPAFGCDLAVPSIIDDWLFIS